jgi:protein disulfide-isomerase
MRATSFSVVVFLAMSAVVQADQGIEWVRDLETAKGIAARTNRPILIHFFGPACMPCQRLDQEVYTRSEVKRALEATFIPVRLNAEEYPATASIYGVDRWPSDVILAPNGQFVARLQCPPSANQYLAQLDLVARGGTSTLAAGTPSNSPSIAAAPAANGAFAAPPIQQAGTHGQPPGGAVSAHASAPVASVGAPMDRIANYDFRNVAPAGPNAVRGSAYAGEPGAPAAGVPAVVASGPPALQQPSQQVAAQLAQQQFNTQSFELVAASDAPPIGLDGFCPVCLRKEGNKQGRWVKGDARFGVVHRGRTYLFSGSAEQQEFLRDPDRYSPVMAGNDPVLACDYGQQVPGQRKIGRYFGDRVYMFASEETLAKFLAEVDESQARSRPNRYAEAILQAENPSRGMLR